MQDIITREIIVNATKERVYKALTEIDQITKWFPSSVEGGTLDIGQQPTFVFDKWNHKTRVYIVDSKPFSYFSYRWIPGGADFVGEVLSVPNTLVEFLIEEHDGKTKVTVKESGFSGLPVEIQEERFNQNSAGWATVMSNFEKELNS